MVVKCISKNPERIASRRCLQNLVFMPLIAAFFLAACASPPQGVTATPPVTAIAATQGNISSQPKPATPQKYLVGINDELEIKFVDRPQLNEAVKVRPDGMISLGLVGTIRAEGRSPQEIEEDLLSRYRALGTDGKAATGKKTYLIQANDELDVKFSYMRALNDSVRVLPDGKISLQLVNSVVAEGKSPEDLSKELTQLYSKHIRMPDLVVIVKKSSSPNYVLDGRPFRSDIADLKPVVIMRSYAVQQIFVGGEVAKPGVFNYRRSLTLSQALIEAGGDKPTGDMRSVIVLRKGEGGQPITIRRDLKADLTVDATNDIFLDPFDVVVLPRSTIANVGLALDQYVFSIFPFIKNSSFAFVDDLTPSSRRQSTVTTVIPR